MAWMGRVGNDLPVAVVGGGPAGSAAAVAVGRRGHDVLLFEAGPRGREKACGDALTSMAVDEATAMLGRGVVASLGGVWTDSVSLVSGGTHLWGVAETSWTIPRVLLDDALRDAAGRTASVLYDHRVVQIEHVEEGFIIGHRSPPGNGETFVAAVILATGANGRLPGRYGVDGCGRKTTSVTWYGDSESPASLEFDFRPDCRPGYAWRFPVEPALVNAGVCLLDGQNGSRLRDRAIAMGAPAGRLRAGVGALWSERGTRWHREAGVVSCGDAGGLVDPLTGEGIAAALASGRHAGEFVSDFLEDARNPVHLARYSAWVEETFRDRYARTGSRRVWELLAGAGAPA